MPNHSHTGFVKPKNGNWKGGGDWSSDSQTTGNGSTSEEGGDKPFPIIHPVQIIYCWERLA